SAWLSCQPSNRRHFQGGKYQTATAGLSNRGRWRSAGVDTEPARSRFSHGGGERWDSGGAGSGVRWFPFDADYLGGHTVRSSGRFGGATHEWIPTFLYGDSWFHRADWRGNKKLDSAGGFYESIA